MENEETKVDEQLKSAYNNGYLIGKHRATIAQSLKQALNPSEGIETTSKTSMLAEGLEEARKENLRLVDQQQTLKELGDLRDSASLENGQDHEID